MTPTSAMVESLESRQLLSVALTSGTLQIDGTRHSDAIAVTVDSTREGRLLVTVNGVSESIRAKNVKQISINAGLGTDTVNLHPDTDVDKPMTILGGSGNDNLNGEGGKSFINGEDGDDLISGSHSNDDTINGGDGEDFILAGNGDNVISGGADNDHITCGTGNDFVSGGAGNDIVDGGGGRDTLQGDNGLDFLSVSEGNGGAGGIVQGGRGDDIITGNLTSTLIGGDGFDTFNTPVISTIKDPGTGDTIHVG
jgi:Ca2+-binding RTX toxin-like protein